MAQKYRKVDPRFWDDERMQKLEPSCKLVSLYLMTGQSNRCGLFVFSMGLAVEHTGMNADSYRKAMAKVCDTLKWTYEEGTRVLYIPTWWKYNAPENEKHLIGCLKDLHDLPATPLLKEFWKNVKFLPEYAKKAFRGGKRIAIPIAMPYQEQEQEQEQNSENPTDSLPASAAGDNGSPDEIHGSGTNGTGAPKASVSHPTVDDIYRAYPRHVEPQAAKRQIAKAITAIRKRGTHAPEAWLLERVQAYAAARQRMATLDPTENDYVPYPQKWFSKGRYDDDPSAWEKPPRSENGKPKPKPAATERGEFPEPARSIPEGRRAVGAGS